MQISFAAACDSMFCGADKSYPNGLPSSQPLSWKMSDHKCSSTRSTFLKCTMVWHAEQFENGLSDWFIVPYCTNATLIQTVTNHYKPIPCENLSKMQEESVLGRSLVGVKPWQNSALDRARWIGLVSSFTGFTVTLSSWRMTPANPRAHTSHS